MNPDTKTVLVILAFVLITILIFRPYHRTNNYGDMEHYNPSFDSRYVDPRVHPYSKDVVFRPDTDKHYALDDIANNDPDKIVVAPYKWANDPNTNTSDIIPATWKRI